MKASAWGYEKKDGIGRKAMQLQKEAMTKMT